MPLIIRTIENVTDNCRLCKRVSEISDRGPAIFSGVIKE
jgi:hypothetical protein